MRAPVQPLQNWPPVSLADGPPHPSGPADLSNTDV